jgi:hypothetical protein
MDPPSPSSGRSRAGESKIMLGGRQKKGQKGLNKANRSHEINDLTQKTNPKQTQNKANKSFV